MSVFHFAKLSPKYQSSVRKYFTNLYMWPFFFLTYPFLPVPRSRAPNAGGKKPPRTPGEATPKAKAKASAKSKGKAKKGVA